MTSTIKPAFATLGEAGVHCDLHPRSIRRAVSAGELPAYRFGPRKGLRVKWEDLNNWIATKQIPTATKGRVS